MATATLASQRKVRIDAKYPTVSHNDLIVGTAAVPTNHAKDACHRSIFFFDLLGCVVDGLAIAAGATITSAILQATVSSGGGAAGNALAGRITRPDYFGFDHTTWNEYDTGSGWTAGGGDIDTTHEQTFAIPSLGLLVDFCDLAAMAQDALDNHGGILPVVLRVENDTAIYTTTSTFWQMPYTAALTDRPPQLVVAHNTAVPADAAIDRRDPAKLPGRRPAAAPAAVRAARPARQARPARS